MRTNLIMHFRCSECGHLLNIEYPEDKPVKSSKKYSVREPGEPAPEDEPSGAFVRYVDAIHVQPCQVCIQREVGPARKLAEALQELVAK